MRHTSLRDIGILCVFLWVGACEGQRSPSVTGANREVVQAILIAPGNPSFHLYAKLTVGKEQRSIGHLEMWWVNGDKYRRELISEGFSQTLIVNDGKTLESDSGDYFPIGLRTLVTAAVDPRPIVDAIRDGDRLLTKANGAVNESGITCYGPTKSLCLKDQNGLRETVAASGHSVDFSRFESFHHLKVARDLTNAPRLGEERMELAVTRLEDLKSADDTLFRVDSASSPEKVMRFVTLRDDDLRADVDGVREIVWPQPLDGAESGPASFYVSFDALGNVREVLQLYTVNERTNDSAKNQLMKWRFKPVTVNGLPAQGEGVLHFTLNTRAFGPREPLTDADVRRLATTIVPPLVEPGKFPVGTKYSAWISVDSEGGLIEGMAGEGPGDLFMPCYDSVKRWHLQPLLMDGKSVPYRAHVTCTVE